MEDFLGGGSWLPVIAAFIPLLVGLLVKSSAANSVKSVVMIVINGLAVLAQTVAASGGILTRETAIAWVYSIVVSVATYYGVWKQLPAGDDNNLGNIAPQAGIG